jgi:hypothetical protein
MMVAYLRYLDIFVKIDGMWFANACSMSIGWRAWPFMTTTNGLVADQKRRGVMGPDGAKCFVLLRGLRALLSGLCPATAPTAVPVGVVKTERRPIAQSGEYRQSWAIAGSKSGRGSPVFWRCYSRRPDQGRCAVVPDRGLFEARSGSRGRPERSRPRKRSARCS